MRLRRKAVYTVTDARRSMSDDIKYRQRRYLVHMGIRTACLILAVVVPMPLPLRAILVFGAIALPYFAVVLANGGREPEPGPRFDTDHAKRSGPRDPPARRREIGP